MQTSSQPSRSTLQVFVAHGTLLSSPSSQQPFTWRVHFVVYAFHIAINMTLVHTPPSTSALYHHHTPPTSSTTLHHHHPHTEILAEDLSNPAEDAKRAAQMKAIAAEMRAELKKIGEEAARAEEAIQKEIDESKAADVCGGGGGVYVCVGCVYVRGSCVYVRGGCGIQMFVGTGCMRCVYACT